MFGSGSDENVIGDKTFEFNSFTLYQFSDENKTDRCKCGTMRGTYE